MHLFRITIDEGSNPGRLRHAHAGPELLLVESGNGLQLTVRGTEECGTGDIFIFPAGCRHLSATDPGQRFTCLVLNADPGDFADGAPGDGGAGLLAQLAGRCAADNRLRVRAATVQRVAGLLRRAIAEETAGARHARCVARALAMQALALLARDAEPPDRRQATAEAAERHVELAGRWLESHWMSPLRIADLVALGRLGRSQLLARFAARHGRTIGETLLAIRVREAQRMLAAGDASLVEIALACGFGSQSHFCHRFRAATGLSPGAWRLRRAAGWSRGGGSRARSGPGR